MIFYFFYVNALKPPEERWHILLKCRWFSSGPAENSILYGDTVCGWEEERRGVLIYCMWNTSTHNIWECTILREEGGDSRQSKTHSLLQCCAPHCPPAAPHVIETLSVASRTHWPEDSTEGGKPTKTRRGWQGLTNWFIIHSVTNVQKVSFLVCFHQLSHSHWNPKTTERQWTLPQYYQIISKSAML